MTYKAGTASDESPIKAGDLNQTHIGLAFGANLDDGTVVYGRVAAVNIGGESVSIFLDGVSSEEEEDISINMRHDEVIYFSRYSEQSLMQETLDGILTELKRRKA